MRTPPGKYMKTKGGEEEKEPGVENQIWNQIESEADRNIDQIRGIRHIIYNQALGVV